MREELYYQAFNNAQKIAFAANGYKDIRDVSLGMVSKVGDVAGKICSVYRDDGGRLSQEKRAAILADIGDVFRHLFIMCAWHDVPAADLVLENQRRTCGDTKNG